MLKERLIARCPNSIFAGQATLKDHRLTFEKPSQDGSGKCGFSPDSSSNVIGVLWSIDPSELPQLDSLEGAGHGYESSLVTLSRDTGEHVEAQTYCATNQKTGIRPYDWYLALVIAGAQQRHLPDKYISALFDTQFQIDNDQKRPSRLQALCSLESANMLGVLNELKTRQKHS